MLSFRRLQNLKHSSVHAGKYIIQEPERSGARQGQLHQWTLTFMPDIQINKSILFSPTVCSTKSILPKTIFRDELITAHKRNRRDVGFSGFWGKKKPGYPGFLYCASYCFLSIIVVWAISSSTAVSKTTLILTSASALSWSVITFSIGTIAHIGSAVINGALLRS